MRAEAGSVTFRRSGGVFGLTVVLVTVVARVAVGAELCSPAWTPGMFGLAGTNGPVYAMAVFDDGHGPAVYVGGEFTLAGTATVSGIARWDGLRWSAVGTGVGGNSAASVRALMVFDDGSGPALYAGGSFTTAGGAPANGIAKWDGQQWSAIGDGVGGDGACVYALAVFDDGGGPALYAGGAFETASGAAANCIAKWDGSHWWPLSGGMGGTTPDSHADVKALAVYDDGGGASLYAGGNFVTAGSAEAKYIAKWDGAEWSALGIGLPYGGYVAALVVFDYGVGPALYVGGQFTEAGGLYARYIARWDGSEWSDLPDTSAATPVSALTVFDDGTGPALYAGGSFWIRDAVSAKGVAKWNGGAWSILADGLEGSVYAMTSFTPPGGGGRPVLYAGGTPSPAGGNLANNVAAWDGVAWSWVGGGTGRSPYVCRTWDSVPSSCPLAGVYTTATFDDGRGPALYAGGNFGASGGGMTANYVARWEPGRPGTWQPLGKKMNGPVYAFAVFDDGHGPKLYAGGAFSLLLPGTRITGIAKWDGTEWAPMAPWPSIRSISGEVYALAVFDDGTGSALYAAGAFSKAGSLPVDNIARWNGSEWSALGEGVNGYVRTLAVFDDGTGPALYAGGVFTIAGGAPANSVAKWDGTQWSALGAGVGGPGGVIALAAHDDGTGRKLYVGGTFYAAGGVEANGIARWDGSEWSAVGNGANSWCKNVRALTVFDDGNGPSLYAGGGFGTGCGAVADGVARWNGVEWSGLGSGIAGTTYPGWYSPPLVFSLGVFEDSGGPSLYVGGGFTEAGGATSVYMARWGCQTARADLDTDGDVDLRDFGHLQACFNGPNQLPAWSDCGDADLDGDLDVDVVDFLRFQRCFNGPNRPTRCP